MQHPNSPVCLADASMEFFLPSKTASIHIAAPGNLCVDITLEIESLPAFSGDHRGLRHGARLSCGGSLNSLIAASRFGASTAPIGFVAEPSQDYLSQYLLASIKRIGLIQDGVVPKDGYATPSCAILVEPNGNRTFISSNDGDLKNTGPSRPELLRLTESMARLVCDSQAVLIDGYSTVGDPELIISTLSLLAERNADYPHVWLDPQAIAASVQIDPVLRQVMKAAYGICVNFDEARALTGMSEGSVCEVVTAIFRNYATTALFILLKRGPEGCMLACRPEVLAQKPSLRIFQGFKIDEMDIVDTSGCGDSFLGAFLAGQYALGLTLNDSCILANAVGAATATKLGTGEAGVANRLDVARIMNNTADGRRILHMDSVKNVFR